MGRFLVYLRGLLAVMLLATMAQAQDTAAPEVPWQDVITAQVEAFRAADAPEAFRYAAAPFQRAFPDAETFLITIVGSGYGPIMSSTSHSFGAYSQLDARSMAQQVMFTGSDLSRHEAIYVLTEEEGGWRVSGVQLVKAPGMGV
jgi:hypothetical protein